MIIQTTPENTPHLVIIQTDHALMSGVFAAAFGNAEFAPIYPAEAMIYVSGHHDEGWAPIDARVEQDKNTGLPYHLTATPLPYLVQTSAGSPAFNEAHHPYSGIMSSMHTYGLFHGRYGLSDKIFINLVPAEHKTAVSDMLQAELEPTRTSQSRNERRPSFGSTGYARNALSQLQTITVFRHAGALFQHGT